MSSTIQTAAARRILRLQSLHKNGTCTSSHSYSYYSSTSDPSSAPLTTAFTSSPRVSTSPSAKDSYTSPSSIINRRYHVATTGRPKPLFQTTPTSSTAGNSSTNSSSSNIILGSTRSLASALPSSNSSIGEPTNSLDSRVGSSQPAGGGGSEDDKKPHRRLSDVPISEVLTSKHNMKWTEPVISHDATVKEAIQVCIENNLSGMMVVDTNHEVTTNSKTTTDTPTNSTRGKVIGMSTSRDLLRIMNGGFNDNKSPSEILNLTVSQYMTPISKVIYARPEETIGMCRSIMAKLGVKCLPILSAGRVEGLITARDIGQFGLNVAERGGKKHFLESVSERSGLGSNTSMAEPPTYLRAHCSSDVKKRKLFTNVGVSELPHPFKTPESCGMNRRDFGAGEVSADSDLSEDAYFVAKFNLPPEAGDTEMRDIVYCGVADGVGSWREYGVDPREFSHKLMQESENILREEACMYKEKTKKDSGYDRRMLTPAEVIAKAFERVKADKVIGSSTACVALFDGSRHQVHFSNLGDSGIIVLRHIDSNIAGALKREKRIPREKRTSDLRVAFVSQQQLRSFNHPFQLGFTGEDTDGEDSPFETAAESCTTSIHVRRGDIVLMATDGLFDNVELEDIEKIALEWEQQCGFIKGGDISAREKRWEKGSSMTLESAERVDELTKALVEKARENSLDNSKDSPFAILAKENDVMWSGGMPDDCTVIAMHIVGAPSE